MIDGQRELFSSIDFRRFTPDSPDGLTASIEVDQDLASGQLLGPVAMNGAEIIQPLTDS